VILFESKELGCQFNLSYLPPGKEMMKRPLDSFVNRAKRSSIDFRLGQKATVENIVAENPDIVIIATGARPILPSIPGLNEILTGEDVLTEKKEVGNRVLIIGGGMVGLECAEYLVTKGHDLTVVELLEDIARDMEPITKKLTVNRLNSSKVKILTGVRITRLEGEKAFIELNEEEKYLGNFDSVVAAIGTRSVDDLIDPLRKRGIKVKTIGDARQPRRIYDAVKEGFETAIKI
jgi:pyruvate/2-oxoglutarate dehydrogenase complex dihydrolipoamide dehydrogenase (E3) component